MARSAGLGAYCRRGGVATATTKGSPGKGSPGPTTPMAPRTATSYSI